MPLEMTRRRPALALELLSLGLKANPDGYRDARLESVELNERLPAEYMADSVVSVVGPDGQRRFVIVEVQRAWDPRKVWSWAAYVGGLMGRHECAVILVVVCVRKATAARYDQPIMPADSCMLLCPVVVGPDQLPMIRTTDDVLASPEIATLSAIAHSDDIDMVTTVGTTMLGLKDDRGPLYYDYLHGQVPEPVRARLEEIMSTTAPATESAYARIVAMWEARAAAEFEAKVTARVEAETKARVEAETKARVEADSKVQASQKITLSILGARALDLNPSQHEMLMSCADPDQLIAWATRAATAATAAEVFDTR
jgi:hypothetical protein